MGFPLAAIAIATTVAGAVLARRADKDRVEQETDQREEIERAVSEALSINKKNLELSRIRSKEQIARQTIQAVGSLRAQVATRVGRSSDALLSSALASGFLASSDIDVQTEMQTEVLETQAKSQIAGIPVAQSTPGVAFLGGLQGLQTGLSLATSIKSLS